MADKGKGRRRGPLSDKSEVLTTRITEDTRRALEVSADKAGRSISQQAELFLVQGLEGSDGSLRHLDAVLESVADIARKLSLAEGGAGLRDSATVYYGVLGALQWACDALPVPKSDPTVSAVAALDDEIGQVRAMRDSLRPVRRLDTRTDGERAANLPSDELEELDRRFKDLCQKRERAIFAIKDTRRAADQAIKTMIEEAAV